MNKIFRKMPLIDWLMWFGLGGYLAYVGLKIGHVPLLLLAGALLTAGYAQLTEKSWAWTAGLCAYAGAGILAVLQLVLHGFSTLRLVMTVTLAWCVWDHLRNRKNAAADAPWENDAGDEENDPRPSLVLWLSEPRHLDDSLLAAIATRALGEPFTGDEEHPHFVVGKGVNYILRFHDTWFLVHNWSRNYFENPEEVAEGVNELRRHEAVRNHRAWLSVDFLRADGDVDPAATLQSIARLIAEIASDGEDVVALYYPPERLVVPWLPELSARLRSDEPLSAFSDTPLAAVVRVSGDSEQLRQGVAEARRRWPEFAEIFSRATDKERFSIKAPITEAGNTEFIWITVKAIADGQVHGLLANEPVRLGKLRLGDFVSVAEADINDWVCPDPEDPDRPLGLFTLNALADRNPSAGED